MAPKPEPTAGQTLRAALDDALAQASKAAGEKLSWDESDRQMIARAAAAADLAERLRGSLRTELDGEARPGTVTKLSAEIRQLDRLVVEFTRRIESGLTALAVGKSERHQRAANARWKRDA